MSKQQDKTLEFTTQGLPIQKAAYLETIIDILNSPEIDRQTLMKCMKLDIPRDADLLRQYAWKVVLRYLPKEKAKWTQEVAKKEEYYRDYLQQYLSPLNIQTSFQEDCKLWIKIQKDTCRTQPQISFFKQPAPSMHFPFTDPDLPQEQQSKPTLMHHYMARILFIHAKANHKVGYAQGMNQVLAPIFYVVHRANSEIIQEAACFFMFLEMLADIYNFYLKIDENSQQKEFKERYLTVSRMISTIDNEILLTLKELNIDPMFYLFRWITLFFAQEFPISHTLRIWDSILAYSDRNSFVNALAVAFLESCKQQIVNGTFADVLKVLKNMSEYINIEEVIIKARQYCESEPGRWNKVEEERQEEDNQKEAESWFPNFLKIKKFW